MAEILYTVAVSFTDAGDAERWLAWLREGHIAEVKAGGATSALVVQLEGEELAFEVQYRFPNRNIFSTYERDHAPRLREEGLRLFPTERGIRYRRSVAAIVHAS